MKNFLFTSLCLLMLAFLLGCEKDDFLQEGQNVTVNQPVSQTANRRSCGLTQHQGKLMKDPMYQRRHEARLRKVAAMGLNKMDCSSPTILPVAVHFQGVTGGDISCLRQLAQRQIDILNADFAGTNTDLDRWTGEASASFPGVTNGEACFRFCLADKNHPQASGLADGVPAVTLNITNGDTDNNWTGYINIFVQPNTGVLGYAPLGGSGDGDGVVIDAAAFGAGAGCGNISPESPYDLGRTLTHEIGHYLLLDHIWGGGCGADDEVADTPDSADSYEGCPSIGLASCGSTDLHMNYMDYTNDACMYMFTNGQVTRSANFLQSSLQSVINNAANVCSNNGGGGGGNTATCDDGIQNGTETGVDCGGSCQPCTTPTGCTVPTNLRTEDLTDSKATLRWNGDGAPAFQLDVRPEGSTNWMSINVAEDVAPLMALAAETTYEWRVRAKCADETSDFSSISTFTTLEHGCTDGDGDDDDDACEPLALVITLDDYGSETSWELLNEEGELVAEGGDYEDFADGTQVSEEFCLPPGCYSLVVYDAAYDGLCCDYGEGFFQLQDEFGDVVYEDDGQFGESTEISFCIEDVESGNAVPGGFSAKPKAKNAARMAGVRKVRRF
jgi:hypothetical protein